MTELNLLKVMQAADAAAKWHVHQRRKGPGQEPYTNHLLEVASLVARATDGQDSEAVVAALLHDAIEDQEVPAELIARNWGEGVATLVLELTDDKTLHKDVVVDDARDEIGPVFYVLGADFEELPADRGNTARRPPKLHHPRTWSFGPAASSGPGKPANGHIAGVRPQPLPLAGRPSPSCRRGMGSGGANTG